MSRQNGDTGFACPQTTHRRQSTKQDAADRIMAAFNTWAFKREQPSDAALLAANVKGALEAQKPLSFILYWGKGPRSAMARPDIECLNYLEAMCGKVRDKYVRGACITLIFTDTHAALNGHTMASADHYFGEIAGAALARGFATCRLGKLVDDLKVHAVDVQSAGRRADTLEQLTRCAARWYRGDGNAADGAAAYYDMNMIEKRAVEQAFPGAVFVTFNGSGYRALFPDNMPIFYMYSLRKGFGVKPWFLEADMSPAVIPPAQAAAA
jgi:L-tyrosine isonitrile synthase